MALRFIDSFNHYATADLTAGKWSNQASGYQSGPTIAAGGRSSNNALLLSFSNDPNARCHLVKNFAASLGSTVYLGFAVKWVTGFFANGPLVELGEIGVGGQFRMLMNASGQIVLQRGSTTVLTTVAALSVGQANYIELKVVIHGTTGIYEVRINGVVQGTFTGNTQSLGVATLSYLAFGVNANPAQTAQAYINDLYVCDSAGAVNNTYLGDVYVAPLLPNGAGATSDFAQTGGTAAQPYTAVNEATPNGDTSYLASAVAPATHTLAFADLVGTPVIKGVAVTMYARKDDAGARTIQAVARSGGVDYGGEIVAPNTSYAEIQALWDLNPATAAAWTASEVNAAQFGIKNVS